MVCSMAKELPIAGKNVNVALQINPDQYYHDIALSYRRLSDRMRNIRNRFSSQSIYDQVYERNGKKVKPALVHFDELRKEYNLKSNTDWSKFGSKQLQDIANSLNYINNLETSTVAGNIQRNKVNKFFGSKGYSKDDINNVWSEYHRLKESLQNKGFYVNYDNDEINYEKRTMDLFKTIMSIEKSDDLVDTLRKLRDDVNSGVNINYIEDILSGRLDSNYMR